MTTKTKVVGLFIMTADDASIPLNSKKEPYVLTGEPDSQVPGFVKFGEVEISFIMPTQAQLVEALRMKILSDRANAVEESTARIAALDTLMQRINKENA